MSDYVLHIEQGPSQVHRIGEDQSKKPKGPKPPKTKKSAKATFKCSLQSCELSGLSCAMRHKRADEGAKDSTGIMSWKNASHSAAGTACATCEAGAARLVLLSEEVDQAMREMRNRARRTRATKASRTEGRALEMQRASREAWEAEDAQ